MNVGSLFSGIGGIELGFERTGFKTAWFVENDQYCQAILKKQFPDAVIYGDITQLDFTSLPKVDILTGGFPCQDISNAGKRTGITGNRSSLWKYYLEAIRILRPRFALIENVSALLNRGLYVVLADLAEVGYDAEWHCVPASTVGAPHRRDRIFIMAHTSIRQLDNDTLRQTDIIRAGEDVANAECRRCCPGSNNQPKHEIHSQGQQSAETNQQGGGYGNVAGKASADVPGCLFDGLSFRNERNSTQFEKRESERCQSCRTYPENKWNWSVEPGMGRVADGVSNRVDRIKCLGNAVVPQVAEVFAKAIREKSTK